MAGAGFALVGVWQVVLGAALAVDLRRRSWVVAARVTAVIVTVVYAATRLTDVPFFGDREPLDALGLLTTLLAIVAALATSTRAVRVGGGVRRVAVPVVVLATAFAAPTVFDLEAQTGELVVAVAAAIAIGVAVGVDRSALVWAAAEGAAAAIVLRAPGVGAGVVAGLLVGLFRALGARTSLVVAPGAAAVAIVLAVPALDARMDLLHVGHPDDTAGAVALFALGGALSLLGWGRGRLAAPVALYGAYTVVEVIRLATGVTSLGAVEVPLTSLSVLLLAVPPLLDDTLLASRRAAVAAGGAAGAAIGLLRAIQVAYPTPWGVVAGVGTVATATRVTARRRPVRRLRTGRASAATLRRSGSSPSRR